MGRGLEFKPSEDDFIIEHAETKTAKQLFELHLLLKEEKMWPERSLKSIARRVERLREEDRISTRDEDTRRKAYYERTRNLRGN